MSKIETWAEVESLGFVPDDEFGPINAARVENPDAYYYFCHPTLPFDCKFNLQRGKLRLGYNMEYNIADLPLTTEAVGLLLSTFALAL